MISGILFTINTNYQGSILKDDIQIFHLKINKFSTKASSAMKKIVNTVVIYLQLKHITIYKQILIWLTV